MRIAGVLVAAVFLAACDDSAVDGGACDCPVVEAACDGCPAIAEQLCIDNTCVERADDVANVVADLSIDRTLDGVVDVTIAVLDARGISCNDVGTLSAAANVLAGSRVDVSGGPFHPDIAFGAVPAGAVLVAADALNEAGDVVGRGCVAVDVVSGSNDVGVLAVAP
jgi:hypothetical protein